MFGKVRLDKILDYSSNTTCDIINGTPDHSPGTADGVPDRSPGREVAPNHSKEVVPNLSTGRDVAPNPGKEMAHNANASPSRSKAPNAALGIDDVRNMPLCIFETDGTFPVASLGEEVPGIWLQGMVDGVLKKFKRNPRAVEWASDQSLSCFGSFVISRKNTVWHAQRVCQLAYRTCSLGNRSCFILVQRDDGTHELVLLPRDGHHEGKTRWIGRP